MLDRDGYRPNVGIILCNGRNEVFWGKRVKEHSWQFPQGGIKFGETPVQAMYRELREEVGLLPSHVKILGRTRNWLRYEVPRSGSSGIGAAITEDRSRSGSCCGWSGASAMCACVLRSAPNSTPGAGMTIGYPSTR